MDNYRFIKSDQSIMMLNLCAAMVIAYAVFISAVERTENEVFYLNRKNIIHVIKYVDRSICSV